MNDSVAVLGAAGSAGRAIVSALRAQDRHVIAVTRRGDVAGIPGLEQRAADLRDREAVVAAVAGADVVVNAAQPPYQHWAAHLEDMVDIAMDGAAAAGARFVMVDNLYMYVPATGPISERSPEHATDPKGALRRRIGERVLARHERGDVSAVLGRASDFYGPHAETSALYITGIAAGVKGRTMRGLFDIDQPRSFAYLPDVAQAFVRMVDDTSGDGSAWVLPASPPATQREMLERVNALLPRRVRIGRVPAAALRVAGVAVPMLREVMSTRPQFSRPWTVDASAFATTYGQLPATPVEQAVAATVASWLEPSGAAAP